MLQPALSRPNHQWICVKAVPAPVTEQKKVMPELGPAS
jgi:hypothetical protein